MKKITEYILGIQHTLAMFGSTVLVPFLTGLPTSLALIGAGVGTLLFHKSTKNKVPVFIGSSFAFITSIQFVLAHESIGALKGGIISAGVIYLLVALMVRFIGAKRIGQLLPPIVVGPIIMSIGLKLVPVALAMSGYKDSVLDVPSFLLAMSAIVVMVFLSLLQKSFFRYMPILMAIICSYLLALYLGKVDTSKILSASFIGLDSKATQFINTAPIFSLSAVLMIAPIALVTLAEHIGEITGTGSIVGKDFTKSPGLHRTLMGDGVATIFAGLIGGPVNTTYAENAGVLAATKVYNPSILRKAAIFAILLGFMGKLVAIVQSIPTPIMGGISLVLFGLISSIGLRILMEGKINFHSYRNLIIPAFIIIIGVFVDGIPLASGFVFSGAFCATALGILLNLIFPDPKAA